MTAVANPSPVTYEWNRVDGISRDEFGRVSYHDGVLNISEVKRSDEGFYTVRASNAEGTTQTKIEIEVLYAPRYDIFYRVSALIFARRPKYVRLFSPPFFSAGVSRCIWEEDGNKRG